MTLAHNRLIRQQRSVESPLNAYETTMIGTETMVRERMRTWRDAGITTLRVYPAGNTLAERLETLGRAIDLVRGINEEAE